MLNAQHEHEFTGDQVDVMILVKHGNAGFCQSTHRMLIFCSPQ
jgi:hypothetical protein